jgi:phosphotriesterase-related protein
MPQIETVNGAVDLDSLGPTLMHEHVFVLSVDYAQNYGPGAWWDEDARVADAVAKLRSLHAKGVTAIADPTVVGLGRYIPRIQKVAAEVPVHIVAATGVYTYGDLPFPYSNRGPGTMFGGEEPMVGDFVRDLREGIADTGVKAAFLKCAVEHAEVSPGVERVLRAVAKAHLETGAPMTVHTSSAEYTGRYVVGVLREEGADLTKLVVGHAGDSNDLDYLMELADTGALLGMDRFGIDLFNPTPSRIQTIAALAERGYADRMVLSHDASCWIDWFGPDVLAMQAALTPNWHYEHISNDVLPALKEAGVTEAQIDQMMLENPKRYFTSTST